MKITGIETFSLSFTLPYSLTTARGESLEREAILVKLLTDDPSISGWGEAAMWGGPHSVSVSMLTEELFPLIDGEDPLRPEYLWEKAYQETYYHGRKGLVLACLSGIDIALWDILGKAAAMPLWRLLGGFGQPVKVYASGGYYRHNWTLDDFADEIRQHRNLGYRGYKMKIANTPDVIHAGIAPDVPLRLSFAEDIRRIEVAREAVGPDADLMCDANTSLDTPTAMRYAEQLERLNVCWFEEPVQPENIDGCAALAARTRVPIAGFETETNKFTFQKLIDAKAIHFVQPDIVQVGGITEARKIAAYAQMQHLPFTSKNYSTSISQAACLQLLYALPNANYFECDIDPLPWREEILKAPAFTMADGFVTPSNRPGLGIDVIESELEKWTVGT